MNIFFFTIFLAELIMRVIGQGPRVYIRDYFNIFDALIGKFMAKTIMLVVTLSIVDISLSFSLNQDNQTSQKTAILAFRAFRLLRVFKLAKSWTQLNRLIKTIFRSLSDISSFSVLLFLLIYIYILVGMQVFSKRNQVETFT